MKTPGADSIHRRLQRIIVRTTGLSLGLACAIFVYLEWSSSLAAEKQAALSTARITADASSAMLAFESKEDAKKLLDAFHAEPDVRLVALYDAAGKLFAFYRATDAIGPAPAKPIPEGMEIEDGRLGVYHPVGEGEKHFGTLYLRVDLRDTYARMARYGWISLLIFAGSLAGAYLIGRLLQQTISKPILSLAGTAQSIAQQKDYGVRARSGGGGELEILTTAFNQMLNTIQEQQVRLRVELVERERAQEAEAREKQLLATTLASIGDAVIATNTLGEVTFLNREAEHLTGWTNAEAIGRPLPEVFRIVNEDGEPQTPNPVEKVLKQGEIVGPAHHAMLVSKDGQKRPIEDSAAPIRQPGGALFGAILVFRDFTERKRFEQALRESEEQVRRQFSELEAIYRTAPLGLCVLDREQRFRRINERLAEINGVPPAGHLGKTPREVVPNLADQVEKAFQKVLAAGEPLRFEIRGQTAKAPGVERVWDEIWYPLRDNAGAIIGLGVVVDEITERKRIERALRDAHEQLASRAVHLEKLVQQRTARLNEMVADLEAFSYSLVHDMRGPLRAMQSFAQLLAQECGTVSPTSEVYVNRIRTAASRMDRLIQDGFNYSRVMKADLRLIPTDVRALLRGMIETYPAFQPPAAEVTLEGEFPPVQANEAALTQCISNLLGNAVKFVEPGVTPRVVVWAERHDGRVRVLFKDNGIGVEEGMHEKIFEIFQRLDTTYEGTGVGLAIVRKAAERMGGSVGFESQKGEGSTFWLELAVAKTMDESAAVPEPAG